MDDLHRWMTHSLQALPWGAIVLRVLSAALQAVDPARAVRRFLRREDAWLWVGERRYDLRLFRCIWLVAFGKAAVPMASTAAEILGQYLTQGIALTKEGFTDEISGTPITILEGGHPVPDLRSITGTRSIIDLVRTAQPQDLILTLISGGGSALLCSPATGISLEDIQNLTKTLLASGATIQEINTLRKHLDLVKGGGLARLAGRAPLATLILSDVVGNPLDVIASGPTVPDPTTFDMAIQTLERYDLLGRTPETILTYLRRGQAREIPETPKSDDPIFAKVQNLVIGSNLQAAQAAIDQAQKEGLNTFLLTSYLEGEASQAGATLAAIAQQIAETGQPAQRPVCLVVGGETTVTIHGAGLGGRNQELALGAVSGLANLPNVVLLSIATDGNDGPTDAAGAVVTGETLELAQQVGLKPTDFLANNDSYHFFEALGDLLKPGPTRTNVNDLILLFAF